MPMFKLDSSPTIPKFDIAPVLEANNNLGKAFANLSNPLEEYQTQLVAADKAKQDRLYNEAVANIYAAKDLNELKNIVMTPGALAEKGLKAETANKALAAFNTQYNALGERSKVANEIEAADRANLTRGLLPDAMRFASQAGTQNFTDWFDVYNAARPKEQWLDPNKIDSNMLTSIFKDDLTNERERQKLEDQLKTNASQRASSAASARTAQAQFDEIQRQLRSENALMNAVNNPTSLTAPGTTVDPNAELNALDPKARLGLIRTDKGIEVNPLEDALLSSIKQTQDPAAAKTIAIGGLTQLIGSSGDNPDLTREYAAALANLQSISSPSKEDIATLFPGYRNLKNFQTQIATKQEALPDLPREEDYVQQEVERYIKSGGTLKNLEAVRAQAKARYNSDPVIRGLNKLNTVAQETAAAKAAARKEQINKEYQDGMARASTEAFKGYQETTKDNTSLLGWVSDTFGDPSGADYLEPWSENVSGVEAKESVKTLLEEQFKDEFKGENRTPAPWEVRAAIELTMPPLKDQQEGIVDPTFDIKKARNMLKQIIAKGSYGAAVAKQQELTAAKTESDLNIDVESTATTREAIKQNLIRMGYSPKQADNFLGKK